MIIFDLDGTLADCEHRKHFVDPKYHPDFYINGKFSLDSHGKYCNVLGERFKPDWKSFYEACDEDKPIDSVISILEYIGEAKVYGSDTSWVDYDKVEIWSGRCESVRKKTENWLRKHLYHYNIGMPDLKMRPIGNQMPDDELKERWLQYSLEEGKTVDFVFDDSEECCNMWISRGVFVFNVSQVIGHF